MELLAWSVVGNIIVRVGVIFIRPLFLIDLIFISITNPMNIFIAQTIVGTSNRAFVDKMPIFLHSFE